MSHDPKMATFVNINAVNKLSFIDFIAKFGNVVEQCPVVAAGIWSKRPFRNVQIMHTHICDSIDEMEFQCTFGLFV